MTSEQTEAAAPFDDRPLADTLARGTGEKAIFEVVVRGTPEAVWHEITKRDAPQEVVFDAVMHVDRLEPGGQVRMRTKDDKYTAVVGEILVWDPPRRYAHTMRFTQYDDAPCTVVYDLAREGDTVRFRLTCLDMPAGTKTTKQMRQGGTMMVNTLKAMVETGRPTLGIRIAYRIFALLGPLMTPKRCRTEHWPFDRKD